MRAWVLACLLFAPWAQAAGADVDQCLAAHVRGQELRAEKKLRAARDAFRSCARESCPGEVREQCAQWSSDVHDTIPSIVLGVRDTTGRDIGGVPLELDGRRLEAKEIGVAIEVDPGPHVVRALPPRKDPIELRVVARESEQRRLVTIDLPAEKVVEHETRTVATRETPPIGGYVMVGAGAVALGVASVLWISARSDFNDYDSSCKPSCPQSEVDGSRRKALIADVLGGVGIALVVGGGYWVLSASRTSSESTRSSGFRLGLGRSF